MLTCIAPAFFFNSAMNKPTLTLLGYYAAFISIGVVASSLGPTLPDLMKQTGVGLSQISILFALRPAGYLIGALVVGRLYDRVPGHPLISAAALVLAGGMAAIPLAPWLVVLAAVSFVIGVAESTVDLGCNTLIVWIYGDRVGPFMNGLHFMFGLGAFIAPLVVAQALALTGGITWAYWVLAALILPSVVWLALRPSPPIRRAESQAEAGGVNYVLVGLIAAFFFLYTGSEISFGAWVFTYAKTLGLAEPAMAAYLTSAFWGALTAGRLLSIPIANRFRPRTILAFSLAGALIGVALPLLLPASRAAIWAGAILAGASMAAIFPTTVSFAERRLRLTGQLTSVFLVGASLGGMFLPWLIGQLLEPVGPWVMMGAILVDLLAGVIVFVVIMRMAPQPKLAQ
jgi:FHS family Na+ dependent glucose MFS transporter 1